MRVVGDYCEEMCQKFFVECTDDWKVMTDATTEFIYVVNFVKKLVDTFTNHFYTIRFKIGTEF